MMYKKILVPQRTRVRHWAIEQFGLKGWSIENICGQLWIIVDLNLHPEAGFVLAVTSAKTVIN